MNRLVQFLKKLFAPKKINYYYKLDEESNEPVQVPLDTPPWPVEDLQPDIAQPDLDVPLFTSEELKEMKKVDLLELAVNSGIADVSNKDTKASLIKKITSHYEIK